MVSDAIRTKARAFVRGLGIEVSRGATPFMRVLKTFDVDLILDVGGNVGQFANWVRRLGYDGRIVSFEPLAQPYAQLKLHADRDPKWETHNIALGDVDGTAEINRSASTTFSSMAEQTELTRRMFGAAEVTARESIVVRRLDSLFDEVRNNAKAVLLKIDTQGFEKRVLDGALASLPAIAGARIELSYARLYADELEYDAMIAHMASLGYRLVMLDPIVFDPAGPAVLQADGTFFRFSN